MSSLPQQLPAACEAIVSSADVSTGDWPLDVSWVHFYSTMIGFKRNLHVWCLCMELDCSSSFSMALFGCGFVTNDRVFLFCLLFCWQGIKNCTPHSRWDLVSWCQNLIWAFWVLVDHNVLMTALFSSPVGTEFGILQWQCAWIFHASWSNCELLPLCDGILMVLFVRLMLERVWLFAFVRPKEVGHICCKAAFNHHCYY